MRYFASLLVRYENAVASHSLEFCGAKCDAIPLIRNTAYGHHRPAVVDKTAMSGFQIVKIIFIIVELLCITVEICM